jgi:hypothetical protein
MLIPARVLALASLLVLLVFGRSTAALAQPDTTVLAFRGFRAGARLDELNDQLRRRGGQPLRCRRSRIDPRVLECRAALQEMGNMIEVWVSAIDSAAGVITLSTMVAPDQLDRLRQDLQDRYGRVGQKVQGTQRMSQWVRRGRMLRLTWRLEKKGRVASVSLVDGWVLDGWARARGSSPAAGPKRAPGEISS